MSKLALGNQGEALACQYFRDRGYSILGTNYRLRCGEIDIILKDRNTLVFAEIKYRQNRRYGSPLEAITATKIKRIIRAAQYYLLRHPHDGPLRFDVLGIVSLGKGEPEYMYVPDAFGA